MKKIKIFRAMLFSSVAIGVIGCAGIPKTAENLPPANGTGAVVIPIDLSDIPVNKKYACRSIVFDVEKAFWKPSEPRESQTWELFLNNTSNMGLITGLAPGDYVFTEYKCYARNRYTLNGAKSYLTYSSSVYFEVQANTVTLASRGFVGTETFDKTGSSTFRARFRTYDKEGADKAREELISRGLPDGWTVGF
ncbi:hypothetical protein K6Q96_10360 [Grimontia kaedaensis]|uniref:Lipoprotein n=1 Tax=Grimontia kaedaensis TaxID=2872157 RepID=A0ABY4WP10_9GAMM|nr:hypothetical protein [Grimontia kaedaensis]USH01328.1 hypothetical protein K6Q96_10360 [Grimontia kaedaensis]